MSSATKVYVDNDGRESYMARIPIDELTIVSEYQRSCKKNVIKRIAKDFHEDRVGALIVAKMQVGRYLVNHVCDGQHRFLAMKEAIKNGDISADAEIPCIVYTNLDEEECRNICADCNRDRATISKDEQFQFDYVNERPLARFIEDLMSEYGFSPIDDPDVAPWNFLHGKAFYRILLSLDKKDASLEECEKDQIAVPYVRMMLNLLSKLWDKDKARVKSNLLKGMHGFFKTYGKYIIEEGISEAELLDVLSRTTPTKINDLALRIKYLSSEKNGGYGGDTNQPTTQRMAFLGAVMMAYKFDYDRFEPSTKLNGSKISDFTMMARLEEASKSEERNSVDVGEFILRKARVKKYRRVKGHGYGYEYFNHEKESQDE